MNHSLCCAYDSLIPSALSAFLMGLAAWFPPFLLAASIIFASPSTVRLSQIFLTPPSPPPPCPVAPSIISLAPPPPPSPPPPLLPPCVATSECPPIWKKIFEAPTVEGLA